MLFRGRSILQFFGCKCVRAANEGVRLAFLYLGGSMPFICPMLGDLCLVFCPLEAQCRDRPLRVLVCLYLDQFIEFLGPLLLLRPPLRRGAVRHRIRRQTVGGSQKCEKQDEIKGQVSHDGADEVE